MAKKKPTPKKPVKKAVKKTPTKKKRKVPEISAVVIQQGKKKKVVFLKGTKKVNKKDVKLKFSLTDEDFIYFQKSANQGWDVNKRFKAVQKFRDYDIMVEHDRIESLFKNKLLIYNGDEFLTKREIQEDILKMARRIYRKFPFFIFKLYAKIKAKTVQINLDDEIYEYVKYAKDEDEEIDYSYSDSNNNWILFKS